MLAPKKKETKTAILLRHFAGLVKSDLGLLILLLLYTWIGALAFYYTEHERDEELKHVMAIERRLYAERVWNLTNHEHLRLCQQHRHPHNHRHQNHHVIQHHVDEVSNWTTTSAPAGEIDVDYLTIEKLLDEYALRKGVIRPNSKLPGWTLWGAIIYCGTVVTTVG